MKAIRWGGLVGFVVLTTIVIVMALFSGVVLKPVLESKFTEMNGASVDIDSVNISYSPFTLEINNVQIADAAEPMLNTAQIDQLKFSLSFARLLMGQLVIDDASIDDVRVETPRTVSGQIIETVSNSEAEVGTDDSAFDVPGFDFPDIDEILAKQPLRTEILLDKLDKDLSSIDLQWQAIKTDLPDSKAMDDYEKRFARIQKDSKGNTQKKLAAIKDAKALINEIKADVTVIKKVKYQFSTDLKHINQRIREIKAAPAKDIKLIKSKYSLDGAGAENVSRMLFGDEVASYLSMARKWYARIEPYLSSDADGPQAETVVVRGKGIDIRFEEYDPRPDFYIEVASITAELPRGKFEGEITHVSSDQSINKKPMRFKLQGVSMVGKESEVLSGEFNYIDHANSFAQINYALSKAELDSLTVSSSSQLPLDMKTALMTSAINARLQKGQLKGVANTQFRQVDFEAGSSSMFASAFAGVKSFDIDVAFSGAIDDLSVQIDSDLDNQLGKQLKSQLAKKRKQFETDLKAGIDKKISGPMAGLDAKKKKLDTVKQAVDDSEKQLQQKITALNETIKKAASEKTDAAKEKLKNKLKDKFGF